MKTEARRHWVGEATGRLPRSRYSHMSDEEFQRLTQFEKASEELLEEYRARFRPARGR